MLHKQFDTKPKNFAIAAIHIYSMSSVPFNRGLVPAQVWNAEEKLHIIMEAVTTFMMFDPGIFLDKFIIVNSGTDDPKTQLFYDKLHGKRTRFGTRIEVLDAPDSEYPGPYGARKAVFDAYPDYKYYFDCDNDCIPLMDGWYKSGVDRLNKDPEIGLLGANISDTNYQCKDNIKWVDAAGQEVPAPKLKYNSGFWTFIPGNVYRLFSKYWGDNWFSQGSTYYDVTASQGELGFPFKVMQLGYKIADYNDDETDAFYSYIVPDSMFPNKTIGQRDDFPSKPKLCPFYHVQLKLFRPEKWEWLQTYIAENKINA